MTESICRCRVKFSPCDFHQHSATEQLVSEAFSEAMERTVVRELLRRAVVMLDAAKLAGQLGETQQGFLSELHADLDRFRVEQEGEKP